MTTGLTVRNARSVSALRTSTQIALPTTSTTNVGLGGEVIREHAEDVEDMRRRELLPSRRAVPRGGLVVPDDAERLEGGSAPEGAGDDAKDALIDVEEFEPGTDDEELGGDIGGGKRDLRLRRCR